MPRKKPRNGFDYAAASGYPAAPGYPAPNYGYPNYHIPPATFGYPVGYNGYMNGYGTGHTHAYGSDGYHQYMRDHDPTYDAYFPEGPSVDDKWRNTYPFVPTAYAYSMDGSLSGQSRHADPAAASAVAKRDHKDSKKGGSSSKTVVDDPELPEGEEKRENWDSKWEFILSCVGLSVGIGNVWRFPYLAYENGGGAFLFPYFILLLVVGKPLYFLEIALGQFSQQGPVGVWRLCPLAKGIGFGMCTISLIVAIYYNVIIAYCFHYIYASFTSVLPWETCDNPWVDQTSCYVRTENSTNITCESGSCRSAAEQYWNNYVLGLGNGSYTTVEESYNSTSNETVLRTYAISKFGEIGTIKWDLAIALFLSWTFVFLCLAKGIKTSGKVVYFSATFPYVILLILLVRGLMLDGAYEGVKYFFTPQWEKLLEISVWRKALEQMFFSLSISWGGLIMFGSYNKFKCKVHIYAVTISSLDFLTSIIAGVVIFSILGEMKLKLGIENIQDVIKQKQGLAFVAYPEAVSLLPIPQLWSVLFFVMLLILGLDSEFALLETFLTGLYDAFPFARKHKVWVVLISCCVCFLISLPCISYSGPFVFDLMDTYGGGVAVFWIAIFETIVVFWIYGVKRFSDDISFMLKHKVSWYFKICWYITPIILTAIFVISCVNWEAPMYDATVHYPEYAHYIGWGLTLLVALQIPVIAVVVTAIYAAKGKLGEVWRPHPLWGPEDQRLQEDYSEFRMEKELGRKRKKGGGNKACKQHPNGPMGYDNYAMQYTQ